MIPSCVSRVAVLMSVIALVTSCVGDSPRERAMHSGAEAKLRVVVLDEGDKVVSNATVEVYFSLSVREGITAKGVSDEMGMYGAKGKTTGDIYVSVSKNGYYPSEEKVDLSVDNERAVEHGRWLPNEIVTNIVLRKIGKPIQLVTTDLGKSYHFQEKDEVLGFDLEKMDWVAPRGRGQTVDFEVRYESDGKRLFDFTGAKLHVRFVRPYDGAYRRRQNKVSKLKVDSVADTNGVYSSELEFYVEKTPDRKWVSNKVGKDEFLVLRTRSRTDGDGNFIGGHYSLVLGEWSFGWSRKAFGHMGLRSLFNPNFNDPNLEEMNIYNTPDFRAIGP